MKKLIFITLTIATTLLFWYGCEEKEDELPGTIYGVITDKATGEPVRAAGVQLSTTGTKTVTGNEGQYEFTELKAGEYSISVTKTGYADLNNYNINVAAGKTNKGDVQIEKLPVALKVVDGSAASIDAIDFGSEASLVSRSFNIFNDSPESLEWIITNNCEWIKELSKAGGTLAAGKQQPVVITIDREKLGAGNNTYVLNISSDNGTKELAITATNSNKLPVLNMLNITNIGASTATFNGRITDAGYPTYTERGFVYSLSSNPTIENSIAKLTSPVTVATDFSANVSSLILDQTYYVRAYAISNNGTAYSTNESSFTTTAVMPMVTTLVVSNINATTATFNGTIVSIGDPAYIERGFVYGTMRNPTIDDNIKRVVSGTGIGQFSSNITELNTGTQYYVRAYATNSKGTVYGTEVNVTPHIPQYIELVSAGIAVQKTDISSGNVNWTTAKELCENSNIGGFNDWRLPTIAELAAIYGNKNLFSGLMQNTVILDYYYYYSPQYYYSYYYYWSSTSSDKNYYLTTNMTDGTQYAGWYNSDWQNMSGTGTHIYYYRTRCVRTLP